MLPHALAVMRQFSFSMPQPGITYLAIHPVSWNEPTILEQRFRPGVPPEEAVLIASDLLHEDYAYMFEAFWDLWMVAENGEWALQTVAGEVPGPRHRNLTTAFISRKATFRWTWEWTRLFFRKMCR